MLICVVLFFSPGMQIDERIIVKLLTSFKSVSLSTLSSLLTDGYMQAVDTRSLTRTMCNMISRGTLTGYLIDGNYIVSTVEPPSMLVEQVLRKVERLSNAAS